MDLSERIHTIPVPTPFPVGPVNLYLLEGDPLTLVDAGPRTDAARDALLAGLSHLGHRPNEIEQIVITHAHIDHIGLLSDLVGLSDAQVLSYPRNFHWLVEFEVEWVRRQAFYAACLYQAGLPDEQVAGVRELMSPGIRLGASIPESRLRTIQPGDEVRAGGATWTVLHMPGHASGHIVLHQPDAGVILAGDMLLAEISSNPVLESPARGESDRPRSLVDYLASLRRFAELDASLTLAGHGPAIVDHRRLAVERLALHRRRLDRITDFVAGGWQTPFEICQAMFPNLVEHDVFLGMSEVIGHLDVLEGAGRVAAEKRGGLLYYTARAGGGD